MKNEQRSCSYSWARGMPHLWILGSPSVTSAGVPLSSLSVMDAAPDLFLRVVICADWKPRQLARLARSRSLDSSMCSSGFARRFFLLNLLGISRWLRIAKAYNCRIPKSIWTLELAGAFWNLLSLICTHAVSGAVFVPENVLARAVDIVSLGPKQHSHLRLPAQASRHLISSKNPWREGISPLKDLSLWKMTLRSWWSNRLNTTSPCDIFRCRSCKSERDAHGALSCNSAMVR